MKKCVVMFILFIAALFITIYIDPEEKITNNQDLALGEKSHAKDFVERKEVATDFEQQVSSYEHIVDNR